MIGNVSLKARIFHFQEELRNHLLYLCTLFPYKGY